MNDWVDAEERIERAQELCESKRWAEALVQVSKALEIHPENPAWWNSKGYLLDQLHRYEEAVEAYQSALAKGHDNRDVLNALGLDYTRIGQYPLAIKTFEKLSRHDPNYEPAYCHRIMLYSELGEHDRAEQMFYLAQQINDQCPHCFWYMGNSLWDRGQAERAIFCWCRVLEIEPRYKGAHRRIAQAYRKSGDIHLAREHFLAEYRAEPSDISLLIEMGDMFLEHRQFDQALQKFRQTIELDPENGHAHTCLGDVFSQLQRDDEALATYEMALRFDDASPAVLFKIATTLMNRGHFREARSRLQQVLELQPLDCRAIMAAGNCSLELGEPAVAQQWFERLIQADDQLPGAHHNLAVSHFLQDRYAEGILCCETALKLKPDYTLAHHKLIIAHMHLGHWRTAKMLLNDALKLTPDSPTLVQLKKQWYRRWITLLLERSTQRLFPRLVKPKILC